jgi:hypothetical protein
MLTMTPKTSRSRRAFRYSTKVAEVRQKSSMPALVTHLSRRWLTTSPSAEAVGVPATGPEVKVGNEMRVVGLA